MIDPPSLTVADLIAKLQSFDQSLLVVTMDDNGVGGYWDVTYVEHNADINKVEIG